MNNSFGSLFRITTFGESHGEALGVTIDGMPAGLDIDPVFIQSEMDRRKPGQSDVTTARKEADQIEILSGVFQGKSTGTPLTMMLRNTDQHSKDYSDLAEVFRPGHADYGFYSKYGIRDYRGGGRSSGRETCARVAAGAVAKLILQHYQISIRACADRIGTVKAAEHQWDFVEKNPVRCADPAVADAMAAVIRDTAADGDSVGGIVYAEICGLPPGLGEPVFDKFDALLAHAMLSIGGIKGIEIGSGFSCAEQMGSQHNDPMTPSGFQSNHAGGILGGISNGNTVQFRLAVKPTPSISKSQKTLDIHGKQIDLQIRGRHDPCLVPRIIPVVEAMAALVTVDLLFRAKNTRLS